MCDLQHFKDAALCQRISSIFSLPHPETSDEESIYKCDFKGCAIRPLVNDQISVFSASYTSTPVHKFCSLDCCFKMLATTSDATLRRCLIEKQIKREPSKKRRQQEEPARQKGTTKKQKKSGTKVVKAIVDDDYEE